MNNRQNTARIKAVHRALEELAEEVVFVGGATVSLYSTRPETETRPTDDVDVIIELANYSNYAELDEKLRSKGFVNDQDSGVICRYVVDGITVDVMPTTDNILGFANRWYPEAYANSETVDLDSELSVRVFAAPYFLASKIEAYNDRGDNDGRMSTDFDDVVHLLNNREPIWEELKATSGELRSFLKGEFEKLIKERYIDEWISAHLDYSEQRRVTLILGGLQDFVATN